MATLRINNTPNTTASTQVMSTQLTLSALAKGGDNGDHSGSRTTPHHASSNQIERISLVKLTPLDQIQNTEGTTSSPLSPNTLTRLVAEQTKSHEALEVLQKRVQADTSVSFTSDIRKELQESALKQRHFLDQVLSSPTTSTSCATRPDDRPTMLQFPNDVIRHATPLTKKLFPDLHCLDDDFRHHDVTHNDVTHKNGVSRQLSESPESDGGKKQRKIKRSDTDNDTGVESDSGSDPGVETSGTRTRGFSTTGRDTRSERVFSPVGKSTPRSMHVADSDDDQLLMYLDAIQRRALDVESLIEKAKLDTVVNIRHQLEAEFKGVPLEEIPSKCHQKIDRAIQRYLQRELENIKAEYERKESGDQGEKPLDTSSPERGEGLERENAALKEKVESLETSVTRVDMLYLMQKKENECLTEKLSKLERQMANEKLMHESELDVVRNGLTEDVAVDDDSLTGNAGHKTQHRGVGDGVGNSEKMASLYQRLEQEEKQNTALKVAGQADQTTVRCLTEKTREMEEQLNGSRKEVGELLSEIHELQEKDDVRERKLKQCEKQLKDVINDRRLLRETLIMSEHEISLLENKLGDENNSTWNEGKHEILGELRKLEKHIKIIHTEKRKLENKYLAFRIENENLSDSLISFGRTRDLLTPLGSSEVSRCESYISSHSSSMSSSLAGSDVEDEGTHHSHHGNRNKLLHSQSGRRRRRGQDHKDKQFAEAVAKKLLFAQKAIKDQNCNFSSFENSGQDLVNEADELVKRVDGLQAEKRAIKMELESIRSIQTENVKC